MRYFNLGGVTGPGNHMSVLQRARDLREEKDIGKQSLYSKRKVCLRD